MADPFRRGVAASLGWRLSIGVGAAVFLVCPPVAFALAGISLIMTGILHHMSGDEVPAVVRGSRDPLAFQLGLISLGVTGILIQLTILAALPMRTVFVPFGIMLIAGGILHRFVCSKAGALARFEKSSRDVQIHLIATGVVSIVAVLGVGWF